jgi:hypothetical protein
LLCVVVAEGSLVGLRANPTFQAVASRIATTKVRAVGPDSIAQARNQAGRPESKCVGQKVGA